MPPQQQPYQPGQVVQPTQPQQQPNNFDFTQNNQPPQQPVQPTQPQQPAFDPNQFKQEVINGVKEIVQGTQQPAQPQPQPQQQPGGQPQYFNKNYDDWGVLEQDTKALVQDVVKEQLQQVNQQAEQAKDTAAKQDQELQQQIDNTLTELRGAGYLPGVTNPFDNNDPGKQAEQELISYAVYLGTSDLAKAAQELKYKHDTGLRYDYQTKQFVQFGVQQDNSPSMFGSLPVTPDGQMPQPQQPAPQQVPQAPMYPQQAPMMQPYGPQNPYMQRYPAGFNAPVSTGGSYMGVGMQGQVPQVGTLRHSSYDQLIDIFNRTQ